MNEKTKLDKILNKKEFIGASPPEVFIGRENYPLVQAGILAPIKSGPTFQYSSPEYWYNKKASIKEIVDFRNQLIYSKFQTNIKNVDNFDASNISDSINIENKKFIKSMSLVSMATDSLDIEFKLKNIPIVKEVKEPSVPIIGNPAFLKSIRIQDNPKINPKVDYVVTDNKLKAVNAIEILYKNNLEISQITKILSSGLLGLKENRKLVPTRWGITATDDTISKLLLSKIRYYQDLSEILLFHGEYIGNHYEVLLLPGKFAFEVIEISSSDFGIWQDYESFFGRKKYAADVTGAYYANRLALCEYLSKIQKQASAIFFREVKPEYNAPLGVGILRELSRDIFTKTPQKVTSIKEAINIMQQRITIPIINYSQRSKIIKEYGKQKQLSDWL